MVTTCYHDPTVFMCSYAQSVIGSATESHSIRIPSAQLLKSW